MSARCVIAGAMVATIIALGTAAPTSAAGNWTLGATGGVATPSGDFGDAMKSGFDGGVFADYWTTDQFAVGIEAAGSFHTAKDEFNDALNTVTEALLLLAGASTASADIEAKARILRFGLRGTLMIPTNSSVTPYFMGGGGLYSITQKLEGSVTADGLTVSLDEDESDSKFGLSGAFGVLFETSPALSVGLQAQIHHVFTEDESTQYFSLGGVARFATGGY